MKKKYLKSSKGLIFILHAFLFTTVFIALQALSSSPVCAEGACNYLCDVTIENYANCISTCNSINNRLISNDLTPFSCEEACLNQGKCQAICKEPSKDDNDSDNGTDEDDGGSVQAGNLGRIGGEGEGLGPFANIGLSLPEAGAQFEAVISGVIGIITIVAGLWFLFNVVIGGINWLSAGGDAKALETARHRITNAFIGLIIVIAAWAIVAVFAAVTGLQILNPAEVIKNINFTNNGNSETGEADTTE